MDGFQQMQAVRRDPRLIDICDSVLKPDHLEPPRAASCPLHAFCHACQRVFRSSRIVLRSKLPEIESSEDYELHQSLLELERSVRRGCNFCAMVWSIKQSQQKVAVALHLWVSR
jgi:hypothetical protein